MVSNSSAIFIEVLLASPGLQPYPTASSALELELLAAYNLELLPARSCCQESSAIHWVLWEPSRTGRVHPAEEPAGKVHRIGGGTQGGHAWEEGSPLCLDGGLGAVWEQIALMVLCSQLRTKLGCSLNSEHCHVQISAIFRKHPVIHSVGFTWDGFRVRFSVRCHQTER